MLRRLVSKARRRGGFTLIELIVVVAILALLAAIAAPRISDVINKSKDARDKADLKVISGALERYYNDKGHYPSRLIDLQLEGYLHSDFKFQNGWGKYYFYAVDKVSDPQHYILGDPGRSPLSATDPKYGIRTATNGETHPVPLPEGRAPTIEAFQWRVNVSDRIRVFKNDASETEFTLSELPPSLARYCGQWDNATNSCASGQLQDRPFRYDAITD